MKHSCDFHFITNKCDKNAHCVLPLQQKDPWKINEWKLQVRMSAVLEI